jgi:hypothetical protein
VFGIGRPVGAMARVVGGVEFVVVGHAPIMPCGRDLVKDFVPVTCVTCSAYTASYASDPTAEDGSC